jgi:hypothetical protein
MFQHNDQRGFTGALSRAGLGIGSTASQVAIAAPNGAGVDYAIAGIAYHKADAASVAITAAPAQAADTTCLYLVCLDSGGTLSTVKGDDVLNTALDAGTAVIHWPAQPAGLCAIGAVKVKTVGVTFTAGTTNLSAAGVTDTYYNFAAGMPIAPLAS